jgi:hypothetical protein
VREGERERERERERKRKRKRERKRKGEREKERAEEREKGIKRHTSVQVDYLDVRRLFVNIFFLPKKTFTCMSVYLVLHNIKFIFVS